MAKVRMRDVIRALVVGLALGWMAMGAAQDYRQASRQGEMALLGG